MKWCFLDSKVAICRMDGGKETEEEKRVGGFRGAARPKLKTPGLIMVIPQRDWIRRHPVGKDYQPEVIRPQTGCL